MITTFSLPEIFDTADLKDTLVIIPAYNEAWNIPDLVRSFRTRVQNWDLLIVNDGSNDRTGELAEMANVFVINLPFNMGIGGCVQTGFQFARKYNYKYALQFDCDGQHLVGEIDHLLEQVINGQHDVVIGSRFLKKHDGYRSSFIRRIGIRMFQGISGLLIQQRITDSTSGFRAYNRKAFSFLAENYPGDFPEPEAVILLKKNGFKIGEVFSQMQARAGGRSSIKKQGVFYMAKVSLAMFMTAIRPRIA